MRGGNGSLDDSVCGLSYAAISIEIETESETGMFRKYLKLRLSF